MKHYIDTNPYKNTFVLSILMLIISLFTSSLSQAKTEDIVDNSDSLKYYLQKNQYSIDSSAQAIILFEKGSSLLKHNVLTYHIQRSIKIINPAVADQVAMIAVPEIGIMNARNIKAVTYNLENGEIVKQEIQKKDIIKDKITHQATALKFTLPSLKAGSIIHYSYTFEYMTFTNLQDWSFQHDFPTLFSEYMISMPSNYPATFMLRTKSPFKEAKSLKEAELMTAGTVTRDYGYKAGKNQTWVRRNVPALKEEPFRKSDPFYQEMVTANIFNEKWSSINDYFFKNNTYYARVYNSNGFLKSIVARLTENQTSNLEKAKSIFRFVRDSIVVDNNVDHGHDLDLRGTFNSRKGSIDEVNLLLTAMLRRADIDAAPLLLHTSSGLPLSPLFADMGKVNYIATYVTIDQDHYYLDATNKYLPFGLLPGYCYNGYCRILAKNGGSSTELSPDMLSNKNVFFTQITVDSGHTFQLDLEQKIGIVAAFRFRQACKNDLTEAKKRIHSMVNDNAFMISDVQIDNLNNPDKSLVIRIKATKTLAENTGTLYMNAFFQRYFDKNPFSATERYNPVDMDYLYQDKYILRFQYPDDFRVADFPKSSLLKLADGSMTLKTLVQVDSAQHMISLNSTLASQKTHFPAAEYQNLRSFFTNLMTIQESKIVLKSI